LCQRTTSKENKQKINFSWPFLASSDFFDVVLFLIIASIVTQNCFLCLLNKVLELILITSACLIPNIIYSYNEVMPNEKFGFYSFFQRLLMIKEKPMHAILNIFECAF